MSHNVKLDYNKDLNRLTVDDDGTIKVFQFGDDKNDRVFNYVLQAIDDLDSGSGGGTNADWNENESSSPSYVLNRTHYKESVSETLMTSKIKPGYSKGFILTADGPAASLQPVTGSLYNVTFNGVSYNNLEAYKVFGDSLATLGNSRMAPGETGSSEYNIDVPFCLVYNNIVGSAKWYVVTESLGTFNFSIEEVSSGNTDSGEVTIDSPIPWMRAVLDAPLLENYVGEHLTLSINNFSASYEIIAVDNGYSTSNLNESEFTEGNIGVMSSNFGQETQLFFIAAESDSGYNGDFTLSSNTEVIHKLSSDYIQKASAIADGDDGFTTGKQVYKYINYPTTDGTYVLKVQDGVPSWVPAT